jgi:hypothetical protein
MLFFDCFLISLLLPRCCFFIRQNHQILSSLPPLPEGGEVDERTVITDESQESSCPNSEVAGSHKSAASSEKETESKASESSRTDSPPLAVSPTKRRGMKSKIPVAPSPLSQLPKKCHPKKRVPSTLTTTQAPLARKFLFC